MHTTPNQSTAKPAPTKPSGTKSPDIAAASGPDTLAALHVHPDTGLTLAEVDVRGRAAQDWAQAEREIRKDEPRK